MRVTIEKRPNKTGDKQSIRLVYWHGSKTDENGKLKHNRTREQLDQFLYVNPKSKIQNRKTAQQRHLGFGRGHPRQTDN